MQKVNTNDVIRAYEPSRDFGRVGRFLVETYQPRRQPANWLQPRWEYMHYLCVPFFGVTTADLERIGILEHGGRIVGVVHFEEGLGQAYFQMHPDHADRWIEMLRYAEDHLSAPGVDGTRSLRIFVSSFDAEFESIAQGLGYRANEAAGEAISRLDPADVAQSEVLPDGFTLQSLADENDVAKVVRVLHRGFNHPGEPPDRDVATMRTLQGAPHFRPDLTLVVRSQEGNYVSYCGVWYEEVNQVAMVEPVATDPDYRRRGFGSAVVREAVRRAGDLGATAAYVGSDRPFYLGLGFKRMGAYSAWERSWPATEHDARPS